RCRGGEIRLGHRGCGEGGRLLRAAGRVGGGLLCAAERVAARGSRGLDEPGRVVGRTGGRAEGALRRLHGRGRAALRLGRAVGRGRCTWHVQLGEGVVRGRDSALGRCGRAASLRGGVGRGLGGGAGRRHVCSCGSVREDRRRFGGGVSLGLRGLGVGGRLLRAAGGGGGRLLRVAERAGARGGRGLDEPGRVVGRTGGRTE